jgi:hypothetical protein
MTRVQNVFDQQKNLLIVANRENKTENRLEFRENSRRLAVKNLTTVKYRPTLYR